MAPATHTVHVQLALGLSTMIRTTIRRIQLALRVRLQIRTLGTRVIISPLVATIMLVRPVNIFHTRLIPVTVVYLAAQTQSVQVGSIRIVCVRPRISFLESLALLVRSAMRMQLQHLVVKQRTTLAPASRVMKEMAYHVLRFLRATMTMIRL